MPCKVLGPDLTKMFQVKHFATIGTSKAGGRES